MGRDNEHLKPNAGRGNLGGGNPGGNPNQRTSYAPYIILGAVILLAVLAAIVF